VLFVGLTGGLGSGKSTVARLLADRGAVVLDADAMAREAVEPGTPGFEQVVARFGKRMVDLATGGLDRKALAATVFGDEQARKDLEAIVHPEVFRSVSERVDQLRGTDAVVVFDAPLIVETGFDGVVDVLVVVTAPEDEQVARVVRDRGMDPEAARDRIRAQSPQDEKLARADEVVRNDGDLAALERSVDRVWKRLLERARGAVRQAPA
jgi:dephospho-CoA kinase